jgi:hypothetical protein
VCTHWRQQSVHAALVWTARLAVIIDHLKVQYYQSDMSEGVASSPPPNLLIPVRVCFQHTLYIEHRRVSAGCVGRGSSMRGLLGWRQCLAGSHASSSEQI